MRSFFITALLLAILSNLAAQTEPLAGKWKTWLIPSGTEYRLPAPAGPDDLNAVVKAQDHLDDKMKQQIRYWGAGSPGYHWTEMIGKLWVTDTSYNGMLANMLLSVGIYDATIAAWDTKYHYNTQRPFAADKRVRALLPKPDSPSYPCEYSVAAGVATTIISQYYPHLKDSVMKHPAWLPACSFPATPKMDFNWEKRSLKRRSPGRRISFHRLPGMEKCPRDPAFGKAPNPCSPSPEKQSR